MKTFTVRRFTGIETKYEATDQNRGTLRRALGIVPAPVGALSSGPKWASAWGKTTFGSDVIAALSAGCAAGSGVHFATISRGTHTFLVAWDHDTAQSVGFWHVAGSGDPGLSSTTGVSISAPATAVYRNKTAGLRWYASMIGDQVWLGNGVDANLTWKSGALHLLGETLATTPNDPSQYAFPPCQEWVMAGDGVVYGAGNATYPLRCWRTDPPNITFPINDGIRTEEQYRDVVLCPATRITALSLLQAGVMAHLDVGGAVMLTGVGLDGASQGWRAQQAFLAVNAGAINQNCVQGTAKLTPYYFGCDLEIYRPAAKRGARKEDWRDDEIITERGSEDWNRDMLKPAAGDTYAAVFDEKNGHFWIFALMAVNSRTGLWVYENRVFGVAGPILYPDAVAVAKIDLEELAGVLAVVVTRDGVLLWTNLAKVGSEDSADWPAFNAAAPVDYTQLAVAPTPDPGIPYVVVNFGTEPASNGAAQVLAGNKVGMSDEWAELSAGCSPGTGFFKNASFAVFELSEEDFGDPTAWKEVCQLRIQWHRQSAAYIGVSGECDGLRYSRWYGGTWNDKKESIIPMEIAGHTMTLRVLMVWFNVSPAQATGLSIDYWPGAQT